MNKIISVFITYNGTPQINLSPLPTISVYNAIDNSVITINQDMIEIGGGFYKHTVVGYDPTIDYLYLADGGASFPDSERYYYGTMTGLDEADTTNLAENVWNLPANGSFPANSFGELIQSLDTATSLSIDLLNILLKYQANRTRIDAPSKTLTVYDNDGTTPLKVFSLLDENGVLTIDSVFERVPQ